MGLKRVILVPRIESRTAKFNKTFGIDSSKIVEIGKWRIMPEDLERLI